MNFFLIYEARTNEQTRLGDFVDVDDDDDDDYDDDDDDDDDITFSFL